MRIRTQLILAAFVLAVVPLAAIVVWSYHSSRVALESAYRRATERTTRQMDRRLGAIRAQLDQSLTIVSALPIPEGGNGDAVGDIVSVMGESASLVDALEFHPITPGVPEAPAETKPQEHRRIEEKRVVRVAEAPAVAAAGEKRKEEDSPAVPEPVVVPGIPASAVAALRAVPSVPVVIDIPAIAQAERFEMSEKQKELIKVLSTLGPKLANRSLSADEREDIEAELHAAEKELRVLLAEDRQKRAAQIREMEQRIQARRERALRDVRVATEAPRVPAAPTSPASVAGTPVAESAPAAVPVPKKKTATDPDKSAKKTSLILGRKFAAPVTKEGELVGQVTAKIRPEQVIQRVLGDAGRDDDEIPFAIDREGTIYARSGVERERIRKMGIVSGLKGSNSFRASGGWIVSATTDPQSGLRIGVARPIGENFDELRKTAARNFGLGMGLIAFALIGIVPLSNHLTRDVKRVTEGAERIALGDLMTRLPVKSDNELGQLARAFNRMAADLSANQQQLLEQERARKEQEMQQRLLELEYERKSFELEEARRFQLSMLPKEIPQFESYEIAVYTRTATEVGGDYYDFHHADDVLSITIGDATGHGAKAGTMVTVIKTLFAGYDGQTSPSSFLASAAEKIKRMDLGRMAMSLALARLEKRRMTLASAGMPPVLLHRAATGSVEEITLGATPLGTIGNEYGEKVVELRDGDTVLFMSDGFPELQNAEGHQLGYVAVHDAFAAAARETNAETVIASLTEKARQWNGDAPPNDDITFVVVRA